MVRGLDYRRGGRPRRRLARWQRGAAAAVAALALGIGLWRAGPWLAARALALPDRLLALAAPAFTARLDALTQENRTLRTALAAAAPLQAENDALRALLGSPARLQQGRWAAARVTARAPGTLTLYCAGSGPAVGAAVLDRCGRYAGSVQAVDGHTAAVVLPGTPACLAAGECGVLLADGGDWQLTGLALPTALRAGDLVTTAAGDWVGTLAADPVPDGNGLTAHAPLADTARLADAVYFVASG